jgi:hypothetical protein
MMAGLFDPYSFLAQACGARGVSGRGQPCPGEKLDLSLSTGQGQEAVSGLVGQCPGEITGLPNT